MYARVLPLGFDSTEGVEKLPLRKFRGHFGWERFSRYFILYKMFCLRVGAVQHQQISNEFDESTKISAFMYDMKLKLGPVITLDKKQYMLLSFWSHVSRLIYRAETIFSESHDVINQLHKPRFISGSSFNFTPYQEAEIVGDIEFSIKFST